MYTIRLKLVTLLLILLGGLVAKSQQDCAFTLDEAQNLYDNGLFDSIPSVLSSCMVEGFTDDEKIRAYRLLVLTYTFNDNMIEAKRTVENFLEDFPEYEIRPSDPIEFVHLFKNYETKPLYSFGFAGGMNFTDAIIIQPVAPIGTDSESYDGNYTFKTSFHGGAYINRYINENVNLILEVLYSNNKFHFSSSIENYGNVSYDETIHAITTPLTCSYEIPLNRYSPYLRLGLGITYLASANAALVRTYDNGEQPEVSGSDIKVLDDRNQFDLAAIVGAGVKIKTKNSYIFVDLRYNYSVFNLVNTDTRNDNENADKLYKYYYQDDDFNLQQISFSIGWAWSFYRTVKQ